MIELLHISDLHFGKQTEKAKLLLKKIKDEFKIGEHKDRYLLVTGDITQDGGKGQFRTAQRALISFKGRIQVVPGNHDYGFLGFIYSEPSAKSFDKILAQGLGIKHPYFPKDPFSTILEDKEGNKVLIIGLNSCLKTLDPLDFASGEIGDKQRDTLGKILNKKKYSDVPKIIFLHHIPHRRAHGIGMSLKDYKELMNLVKDRVDAFAFGHEGSMEHLKGIDIKRIKISDREQKKLGAINKMSIPVREMKLRSGKGQGIRYYLDANRSVEEMACYHIKISEKGVTARLTKLI